MTLVLLSVTRCTPPRSSAGTSDLDEADLKRIQRERKEKKYKEQAEEKELIKPEGEPNSSAKNTTLPVQNPETQKATIPLAPPDRDPISTFPTQVNGFSFGMTYSEASKVCNDAGGFDKMSKIAKNHIPGVLPFWCSVIPAESSLDVNWLSVNFCSNKRVCNIFAAIHQEEPAPEKSKKVLLLLLSTAKTLVKKYGAPSVSNKFEEVDKMVFDCSTHHENSAGLGWFWKSGSVIGLTYSCRKDSDGLSQDIVVSYGNDMFARDSAASEQHKNGQF